MTHQKCIHDPAQDLGGNQRVRLTVRMVVQLGHPQRALGAMAPEAVDQLENGHMVRRERILDLLVRCREGILPVDFAELGQDGDEKFRAVFVRSRRQFRQRLLGRFKPRPPVLGTARRSTPSSSDECRSGAASSRTAKPCRPPGRSGPPGRASARSAPAPHH